MPVRDLPDRLPCDVQLDQGPRFSKGVPTRLLLDALSRRADYQEKQAACEHDFQEIAMPFDGRRVTLCRKCWAKPEEPQS